MSSKIGKENVFLKNIPCFKENINVISETFGLELINKFTSFRSFSNILLLVYADIENYLVFFDLEKNIVFKRINPYHEETISLSYHHKDLRENNDLIVSISSADFNSKIWDISSFQLVANLTQIYQNGFIKSCYFINYNLNIFLAFVNNINGISDKIKIINIENNDNNFTIDINGPFTFKILTFNDKSKTYIVVCNYENIISYIINTLSIFQKYTDDEASWRLSDMELFLVEDVSMSRTCPGKIQGSHLGVYKKVQKNPR